MVPLVKGAKKELKGYTRAHKVLLETSIQKGRAPIVTRTHKDS